MTQNLELKSDLSLDQMNVLMEMMEQVRGISGDILEIGSWRCGTSATLAGFFQDRTIYAFDLFGGMPYGITGAPWDYFDGTDWEEIQKTAEHFENLKLIRGLHEETIPKFAEAGRPIALLFMDSDHYSSHKVSLEKLVPLIPSGGIIVFHDWTFEDVQRAAEETLNRKDWAQFAGDLYGMGALRKN
jgi:hypothetical protein